MGNGHSRMNFPDSCCFPDSTLSLTKARHVLADEEKPVVSIIHDNCLLELLYKILLDSGHVVKSFKAVAIEDKVVVCYIHGFLTGRNWYYGEKKTESGDNEANPHSYFAGIGVFSVLSDLACDIIVYKGLKNTPHYRILINKANGFGKSTAYVPEEEIIIIMGLEVVHHPDMETYFRGYDGSKYIMQPWLKKLYPHD
ncbi:hypothetical protein BTVI_35926 [Pitangus sulphuratus]|nr:hypothetical protein BTVI_35926 [Pitangus sulphuratus]